jgi:hypothetical protein
MKFFYFFVTVSLIGISCRKNSTIYNGFIKNDTKSDITFKIIADSSLADSFNLASKSSVLVFTYQEEGDFELYDCTSFFDTLYFTRNDTDFFLVPDSSEIATSSFLNSKTRTHDCYVKIQ